MDSILPSAFIRTVEGAKGFDKDSFIKVHQNGELLTSVRFNPLKKTASGQYDFAVQEKISWCSEGYYLPSRPSFTIDPLFHAGAYYVQEASSMFLETVLKQAADLSHPLKVLDLCAAPGGKSTLIQSILGNDSLLVANEVIKTRVSILTENLTKWGAVNTVVSNNDPSDFKRLSGFFDVIVVDAPCSGSGMFRKDPDAIKEWSEDNVSLCHHRQQRILADVLPALREGGVLVYSTCSYSPAENENICDWLIAEQGMQSLQVNIQTFPGIVETVSPLMGGHGYRFYPDKVKGEGFFIASFIKTKEADVADVLHGKNKMEFLPSPSVELLNKWLKKDHDISFFLQSGDIVAFPVAQISSLDILRGALYIKKAGVVVGSLIREELVPAHALAMSGLLRDDIQSAALSLDDARQYLRHQSFQIAEALRGWTLMRYDGIALGFVKAMPGRMNNYYPREWRILNK